ncbi:MAG: hypothetical protein AAF661_07845 [Pseudomonadota bacterium]
MRAESIDDEKLGAALIAAHDARDGARLARLYAMAADAKEAGGDLEAACFYLVHAYVHALEANAPESAEIRKRLVAHGREA